VNLSISQLLPVSSLYLNKGAVPRPGYSQLGVSPTCVEQRIRVASMEQCRKCKQSVPSRSIREQAGKQTHLTGAADRAGGQCAGYFLGRGVAALGEAAGVPAVLLPSAVALLAILDDAVAAQRGLGLCKHQVRLLDLAPPLDSPRPSRPSRPSRLSTKLRVRISRTKSAHPLLSRQTFLSRYFRRLPRPYRMSINFLHSAPHPPINFNFKGHGYNRVTPHSAKLKIYLCIIARPAFPFPLARPSFYHSFTLLSPFFHPSFTLLSPFFHPSFTPSPPLNARLCALPRQGVRINCLG
jgi:hypothetical protein